MLIAKLKDQQILLSGKELFLGDVCRLKLYFEHLPLYLHEMADLSQQYIHVPRAAKGDFLRVTISLENSLEKPPSRIYRFFDNILLFFMGRRARWSPKKF